jgi:hypothetical protein
MTQSYKYTAESNKDKDNKPILTVKKQLIKFPGQYIRVFDSNNRLVAKAHSLPFKLKEQLAIYSDEENKNQIAYVTTHKILDFNAAFIIKTSKDGETLGGIRRKGLQSEIGQDTWLVYSKDGDEIAKLQEQNLKWSLVRKWLLPWLPQTYHLSLIDGSATLKINQNWTPVILRCKVFSDNYHKFTKSSASKITGFNFINNSRN